MENKTYIKQLILIVISFVALISVANIAIDPYRLFNSPDIKKINNIRPYEYEFSKQGKAIQAVRIKPKTLIIGTSRSEIGIPTDYNAWEHKPVFNISYPKLRIKDVKQYIKHANSSSKLEYVFLSLDFLMFNSLISSDIKDEFPLYNNDSLFLYYIKNMRYFVNHVMSWEALKSSYKTLKYSFYNIDNKDLFYTSHQKNGFRYKLKNSEAFSQRAIFYAYEVYYFFGDMWLTKKDGKFSFTNKANKPFNSLEELREIFAYLYGNNIDFSSVLLPSHARLWFCLDILGLWDEWENWKKEIVKINEEEALKAGVEAKSLWDFTGFNEITTEKLPSLNDKNTKMKYYFDSSHFKPNLGKKVIDIVLRDKKNKNFGRKLTNENIANVLAEIRVEKKIWALSNKNDMLELYLLFSDKRNKQLVYDPFLNISQ